jgi:hypothetical protein
MYALVTTHRSVIMSVTVNADVDALKDHVAQSLALPLASTLRWTNYLSHWGTVTNDGLTAHTIHKVEVL